MTPLRYHRVHVAKISLRAMAEELGIDRGTLSRIETGGADGLYRASRDYAAMIAAYFDYAVTRDQILFPECYLRDGKERRDRPKFKDLVA